MLQSTRRGLFRHSYDITEDGRPITTITVTRREGAAFEVDGRSYRIARDGSRQFTLHGPDGELDHAERVNGRTWTASSPAGQLELARTSLWKETWELRLAGPPIGTLRRDGPFKRTSTADLPARLPMPTRLFVLYVVETLWERNRQAAAAGGG